MAKCRWCDIVLPGDAIPACNRCLFSTRTEADPSNDDVDYDPIVDSDKANYDLSELNGERDKHYTEGKTKGSVKHTLHTQTAYQELPRENQEIPMKRVKIKSNSIRSRVFVVDELVLSFDENGIAEINESDVPVITAYSRARPNRLSVVVEPVKVPAPAPRPAPAPAPKKVEPKVEPKVESKKVVEPVTKGVTKSGSSDKSSKKTTKSDSE